MSIRPWLSVTSNSSASRLPLRGRAVLDAQSVDHPNYWPYTGFGNPVEYTKLPKITFNNLVFAQNGWALSPSVFDGLTVQSLGSPTFDIDNPSAFSFGNSVFGYFNTDAATVESLVNNVIAATALTPEKNDPQSITLRFNGTYTSGTANSALFTAGTVRAWALFVLNLKPPFATNSTTGYASGLSDCQLYFGEQRVPYIIPRGQMVYDVFHANAQSFPFDRLWANFDGTFLERQQAYLSIGISFANRVLGSRATQFIVNFSNFPSAVLEAVNGWAVKRNGSLLVRSSSLTPESYYTSTAYIPYTASPPTGWSYSWNSTTRQLTINTDATGLGYNDSFVVRLRVSSPNFAQIKLLANTQSSSTGFVTLTTMADSFTATASLENYVNTAERRYNCSGSWDQIPRVTAVVDV